MAEGDVLGRVGGAGRAPRSLALERRIEADLRAGASGARRPSSRRSWPRIRCASARAACSWLALYRCGARPTRSPSTATRGRPRRRARARAGRGVAGARGSILRQDSLVEPRLPVAARPGARSLVALPRALDGLAVALAEPLAHAGGPARCSILTKSGDAGELAAAAAALATRARAASQRGRRPRRRVHVTRARRRPRRLAAEQDVDLVLVDAPEGLLEDAACSRCSSTLPATSPSSSAARPARARARPFAGAEHDWAAVELAAWLRARRARPAARRLHDGPDGRDASRLLASASLAVQRALGVRGRAAARRARPGGARRGGARGAGARRRRSHRPLAARGLGRVRTALATPRHRADAARPARAPAGRARAAREPDTLHLDDRRLTCCLPRPGRGCGFPAGLAPGPGGGAFESSPPKVCSTRLRPRPAR